jgi:predicted  nucleic acid-binding Zn-ribbon protein
MNLTKALWEIIGGLKQEVADLKIELKEAEDGNSLSRPTIRNIYSSVRKLGRQINNVDWLITKQETHENLQIEMEILKQDFDDLEKHLP